ncbi:MAG: XisI protein [Planctomycetes bacterium]|nr:XisI protein [Planctomycetota bacterium]
MDKLTHYQNLTKRFFTEYANLLKAPPEPELEIILVFDDKRNHYLLLEMGWQNTHHIRRTNLHIAIRNNKIWIEEDWTEEGIATYFLEQGVPPDDIVLGFQPPQMRPYTEFAAA